MCARDSTAVLRQPCFRWRFGCSSQGEIFASRVWRAIVDDRRSQPLRESSGTGKAFFRRRQWMPCGQKPWQMALVVRLRFVGESNASRSDKSQSNQPKPKKSGSFFGKLARRCSTPEGVVSEKLPMVRNAVLCTPYRLLFRHRAREVGKSDGSRWICGRQKVE